jgi:hypothetical protein
METLAERKEDKAAREAAEELAAQAKDLAEAEVEVDAYSEIPAPWTEIRQHIGIGPLAYETKRGLVKVHSGEFIMTWEYPVLQADGVTTVMERETIVLKEEAAKALVPPPTDLPLAAPARAARKTEARHKTEKPVEKVRPSNPIVEPKPPVARPKA